MGYITKYRLGVVLNPSTKTVGELIYQLRESDEDARYAVNSGGLGECKWYNHDDCMVAFSIKHPHVVFKLNGEGEDPPDYWQKYYKNGQIQEVRGKLVFPDFDESKLK